MRPKKVYFLRLCLGFVRLQARFVPSLILFNDWHDDQMLDCEQAKISKKNRRKPMQKEFWKMLVHGVLV